MISVQRARLFLGASLLLALFLVFRADDALARDPVSWPRPKLIAAVEGLREVELLFTRDGALRWIAKPPGTPSDTLYAANFAPLGTPPGYSTLCALPGRAGVSLDQSAVVVRHGSVLKIVDPVDCQTRETVDFAAAVIDADFSEATQALVALVRRETLSLELRQKDRWSVWPAVSAPIEVGLTPTGEAINLDTSHAFAKIWRSNDPAPHELRVPARSSLFFAPSAPVVFAGRLGEVHRFDWPLSRVSTGKRITLPMNATVRAAVEGGRYLLLDTGTGLAVFDTVTESTQQLAKGQPEAVAMSPRGDALAFVMREGRFAKVYEISRAGPLFAQDSVKSKGH